LSETLGSLIDKISIVNLKIEHTKDKDKIENLYTQNRNLCEEIEEYINDALLGKVAINKLQIKANKVYDEGKYIIKIDNNSIGNNISQLISCNIKIWREQENIYNFERVPESKKNVVIKNIAELNLERNKLIELIDQEFVKILTLKKL
jgi:hypothetical protein